MDEFLGETRVHAEVFERIAVEAAMRVPGVAEVIQNLGLWGMLSKVRGSRPAESTESESSEGKIFEIHVSLKPGTVIPQVARKIQETVKETIERMTEQKVAAVNVYIEKFSPEARTSALSNSQRRLYADEEAEEH